MDATVAGHSRTSAPAPPGADVLCGGAAAWFPPEADVPWCGPSVPAPPGSDRPSWWLSRPPGRGSHRVLGPTLARSDGAGDGGPWSVHGGASTTLRRVVPARRSGRDATRRPPRKWGGRRWFRG